MSKRFSNMNNPVTNQSVDVLDQIVKTNSNETIVNTDSDEVSTGAVDTVPMKLNPRYIETKSQRIQLLIQPSLKNKIKKLAHQENRSVNDLIHSILEEYMHGKN